MLRSQKKIVFIHDKPTHTDVFVEHYDQLKRWAFRFTKHDHELAEDLLHDVFLHFTLTKIDLDAIENLESYLYVSMRNLHLSQIRKATRIPTQSMTAVDYDTVGIGLFASDPRDRMRLRDDLVAICYYACIRKESLKAASVLILRFFHGYYPEEIADVMRSTRAMVNNRLRQARAEARTYLEEPERLSFLGENLAKPSAIKGNGEGSDLRLVLRQQIFESKHGACVTPEALKEMYASAGEESIQTSTLAHSVSCQMCMDAINGLLDLPLLASRYPLDMIGKDPGPTDKSGGGSGAGGGGGSNMLDSYINLREEFYHHQPEELCVSANGIFQGGQKVASDRNELRLVIDLQETLGFVEVFSEQGLRLLMMNVEPLPAGDGEQSAIVELSSGRTLDVNLNFSGQFPTLQVNYNDPQLAEESALEITTAPNTNSVPIHVPFAEAKENISFIDRLKGFFQPMQIAVAATVLVGMLAAAWFVMQPTTVQPVTARAVLKQARDAEFELAPTAEKVLHRNYQVEEWTNGSLSSRKRVDEWRQPKISARRIYDEGGQMVAGVWTRENGSQQVFTQGEKLRDVYARDAVSVLSAVAGGAFPSEPTANAFANLVDRHGVTNRVAVEERAAQYIFNFEDRANETEQRGIDDRLIAASLMLDRSTFNPISQTIVLQVGNEVREYRFSDVRVEQRPIGEVSPLIFQPEAELAKGATKVTKPVLSVPPAVAGGDLSATSGSASSSGATLDAEVEVFRALDSVNALSGDQINVTRTASGQLKISGIVDSAQRKAEILNALNSIKNSPGVTIDILTGTEAAQRQKQTITGDNITIESVTAEVNTQLPVEPELRNYFAKRGVAGESVNNEIKEYASAVLNRSRALRRDALALKSLAERFSSAEIEKLDATKRDQWKALLRSKAAAVAGDVRSLQSQLSAVGLNAGGGDPSGGANINDASDLSSAAQRLFGLAAACDAQVQQSFSISGRGGAAQVRAVQFWRNLSQMSAIAADVQRF